MGRKKTRFGNCINGCDEPVHARSVCKSCYRRIHYEEHERARRGAKKHDNLPIGSVAIDKTGYARIKVSCGHGCRDWKKHHRIVMEEILGRPLHKFENVHHKNGIKSDNSKKNLELWITYQLKGQRVKDLIEYANWILNTYKNDKNFC